MSAYFGRYLSQADVADLRANEELVPLRPDYRLWIQKTLNRVIGLVAEMQSM